MAEIPNHSIKVSVDRGGTFTDVFATWPDPTPGNPKNQKEVILKLLSRDPSHYSDAPREGIRRVLEIATNGKIPRDEPVPVDKLGTIRLSTTVATNALLERQGAKHALLVTKGFRDLLKIGNQARPRIFDLAIKRPDVLYDTVVEVDERVTLLGYTSDPRKNERAVVFDEKGKVVRGYDGESYEEGEVIKGLSGEAVRIIKRLDETAITADLEKLYSEGYRSLAVVLMHSFTFPDHEQRIEALAKKIGFTFVSISSSSMPMIRIVARGTSTTADAYLTPVLQTYIDSFFSGFDSSLRENVESENKHGVVVEFMRSDGGLTNVKGFSGLKSILSGPAGGVVGFALTSWENGGAPVIGLDMGGTSTDVSRFDGEYETVFETTTAGVTIQSPQLNINTVAAGGGSRLFWRNGLFVTGPESASSDPGPACYRKNGPPAITDANLTLGRLLPEYFPSIFGSSEKEPLDVSASVSALEALRDQVNADTMGSMTTDEVALGFIKVANETMCRPIRALTEARGYDTSKHILASFGGAGGQHACAIAKSLGIHTILIHRYSSILSAYGMALSERVFELQEPSSEVWGAKNAESELRTRLAPLEEKVHVELIEQGFAADQIEIHSYLNMRYTGTDTALMVHQPAEGWDFALAFAEQYKQEFGFIMDASIIVDDIRVRGVGRSYDSLPESVFKDLDSFSFSTSPSSKSLSSVYFEEVGRVDTPVFLIDDLSPGDLITGPAMIIDGTQTIVVDPEAAAKITSRHVVIEL